MLAQTLGGEAALVGWVVTDAETETVKAELSARLPEYMIPTVFVALDKFPRDTNGKIERSNSIRKQARRKFDLTEPSIFDIILDENVSVSLLCQMD